MSSSSSRSTRRSMSPPTRWTRSIRAQRCSRRSRVTSSAKRCIWASSGGRSRRQFRGGIRRSAGLRTACVNRRRIGIQGGVKPSRRDFLRSSIMLPGTAAVAAQRGNRAPLRVAVVGAGAFGGWTALHLRRAGALVTLLDAWGPGNSRASSGGETRVIRTIYGPTRKYVEMAARALALWREWDQPAGEQFYRRTGVLWMTSADDSYVRQSLPFLRELGLEFEQIDPSAAARRWPQISFDGIA